MFTLLLVFLNLAERRDSNTIQYLLLILLSMSAQMLNCSEKNKPEPTFPKGSIDEIAWSPDGSKIAIEYCPLMLDTIIDQYQSIIDSAGLWFINRDGSNLKMFLPGHFVGLDYHPDGTKIITAGYEINIIDSSLTYLPWVWGLPRYSPDGSKVLCSNFVGDSAGIWIASIDGTYKRRLGIEGYFGDWAPNGREIVCARWPHEPTPLVIADTSGTIIKELPLPPTYASMPILWPPSFSPDGTKILFEYNTDSLLSDWQIYVINRDGTGLEQLTEDGGRCPVWSPDGKKIAYIKYSYWGSEEAGDGQLWVMNADGSGKTQLTFVKPKGEK
ncbi:MAG: hypothetical protein ABIL40_07635 [candidate division WOR-3 bacterium]